jgi:hypothetical protein
MNMKKPRRSKSRGSALPLAVLAVMMLFAMGVALLGFGLNSRTYSVRTASVITSRCMVDYGLAIALFEMNKKLQVNIEIIRYRRECSVLRHQGQEQVFRIQAIE